MKRFGFIVFVFACFHLPTWASSAPYGSDGLQYLFQESELIVVATAAKPHSKGEFYEFYTIEVGKTFLGKAPEVPLVASLHEITIPKEGRILFLSSVSEKDDGEFKGKGPLYSLYGSSPATPQIEAAIKEWASAFTEEKELAFGLKYLEDKEGFLKRSAWLILERLSTRIYSHDLFDSEVIAATAKGLSDGHSRMLALRILCSVGTAESLQPLVDLVENEKTDVRWRTEIIQHMSVAPAGYEHVKAWKDSSTLSDKLKTVCDAIYRQKENIRTVLDEHAFKKITSDIESTNDRTQIAGFDSLSEYAPNEELMDFFKSFLEKNKTSSKQLRAINALAVLGHAKDGAKLVTPLLIDLAIDDSHEELVNASALFAIASFKDYPVCIPAMKKIATEAKSKKIADLANDTAKLLERYFHTKRR